MKKVRIVAPAKNIEEVHIDNAKQFLREKGFEVEIGTYTLGKHHYFSGTIAERLSDFQFALDDPSIDIILCARGGYGSVQLIDQLDFTKFKENPKLIVGYSDITVFHNHVPKHYNLPTVHATAPLNFSENTPEALDSFLNSLLGRSNTYHIAPTEWNVEGEVTAPLIGGNLAILHSLLGTNSDADYQDKILFVEEIGEAIYAVDRMFYAFEKAGKLKQIKGLIVGGMTNMKDSEIPYGMGVEEVILRHVSNYQIPVCFNFPAGHISDNRALIIGQQASLNVGPGGVTFEQ